ncbi:MAG: hypothetical protein WAL48_16645 [Xanthobacteraceae bacterium]
MASLDVIGAITMTAAAAFLVGTIAAVYPGPLPARLRLIGAFALWFTLVVLASGLGLLDPVTGFGVPALGFAIVVPIVVMAFVATSSGERLQRVLALPMPALILTHVLRILAVQFLLLWSAGRLTAPFAPLAGWGDIITGVTAVPVAWAVWRKAAGWRPLAVIWNLFGAADLIDAISLGVLSAPRSPLQLFAIRSEPVMTTLPWVLIPGYLVPLLFMTHVLMLAQLGAHAPAVDLRAQRL